jgi:hypothetical protein
MIRRTRRQGLPFIVALFAIASAAYADTKVPFVGCQADGGADPGTPPPPKGSPIAVAIDPAIAHRLAYYKADTGPGVLAPLGCYCHSWRGSPGNTLLVTPKALPSAFGFTAGSKLNGPAVYVRSLHAGTSGRFPVAIVAARLFPKIAHTFIERIKAEDIEPANDFDVKSYPTDQLNYLSDRVVEFTTPAGQDGFGTTGTLRASALPIRGVVRLNLEAETDSLQEIVLRLPAGLSDMASPILEWGKRLHRSRPTVSALTSLPRPHP